MKISRKDFEEMSERISRIEAAVLILLDQHQKLEAAYRHLAEKVLEIQNQLTSEMSDAIEKIRRIAN